MQCKQSEYHYPAVVMVHLSSTGRPVQTSEGPCKIAVQLRTVSMHQDRKWVTGHFTINNGKQFAGAPFEATHFVAVLILSACLDEQVQEARRPTKSPNISCQLQPFMPEQTRSHNYTTILNNTAIERHIIYQGMSLNELVKNTFNVFLALFYKKKKKSERHNSCYSQNSLVQIREKLRTPGLAKCT